MLKKFRVQSIRNCVLNAASLSSWIAYTSDSFYSLLWVHLFLYVLLQSLHSLESASLLMLLNVLFFSSDGFLSYVLFGILINSIFTDNVTSFCMLSIYCVRRIASCFFAACIFVASLSFKSERIRVFFLLNPLLISINSPLEVEICIFDED